MLSVTEKHNPDTVDIDLQNGENIAKMINNEDKKVALAVEKEISKIGLAIDEITERVKKGGKIGYFGAGTSGRICILDASEMPPTYSADKDLFQAFIAGREKAIRESVENSEDSIEMARLDMADFHVFAKDTVIAVSASGNPRYVVEVLRMAKYKKALTIAVSSNPDAKMKEYADIFICPIVGPEAVTGSSRMKAGTAQKMVLNMISTGVMIKTGKTYKNYMIDLSVSNEKLRARALRFIKEITGVEGEKAESALAEAQSVKIACVMLSKNVSKTEAEKLLVEAGGILRKIIL
ncbi:MAG: N-acetylmuramic acid 6-phosphate etherase [Alphaproteobacteria bacterium]|nr:N-acetylmuramic acid 6-phosphate etherase [Alphaproteobacteria bacterium]